MMPRPQWEEPQLWRQEPRLRRPGEFTFCGDLRAAGVQRRLHACHTCACWCDTSEHPKLRTRRTS